MRRRRVQAPRRRTDKQLTTEAADKIERQAAWIGRRNYNLNSETVLRDAYRLLCIATGDEGIAMLSDSKHDPLAVVRDQFIEDELVHLLISTAIMNRSQDDHMAGPRNDGAELGFAPLVHECGILLNDVVKKSAKTVPLNFREACNKIIHADEIIAEVGEIEGAAYPIFSKTLVLRGRQGNRSWQATLKVADYVRGTFKNFQL